MDRVQIPHREWYFFKYCRKKAKKMYFNLILQNEKKTITQRKLRFSSSSEISTLLCRVVRRCYVRSEFCCGYIAACYFFANFCLTCTYCLTVCMIFFFLRCIIFFTRMCFLRKIPDMRALIVFIEGRILFDIE